MSHEGPKYFAEKEIIMYPKFLCIPANYIYDVIIILSIWVCISCLKNTPKFRCDSGRFKGTVNDNVSNIWCVPVKNVCMTQWIFLTWNKEGQQQQEVCKEVARQFGEIFNGFSKNNRSFLCLFFIWIKLGFTFFF